MVQNEDFSLSEDEVALRSEARKFALNEIRPIASSLDETSNFPSDIIKKGASLGLMNLSIPSDFGGTGLGIFGACLVIEELSWGCGGVATSMVANDLALTPILVGGNLEQKKKFVEPVVSKGKLASFCLTEPGAGSDAAGLTTTVEKEGDYYVINGAKQWITNGGFADQFTVFATIDKSKKHKGICCLVVPGDAEGVTRGHHENKMGQRCSNTTTINFDKVKVPADRLIGSEGEGFSIAMKTLDLSRPLTASIAVGIGRAAFEYALQYSNERKQFSQLISSFQGVQFMIADMATELEASRLLTMNSARMLDAGLQASLYSSMAKRFAADATMKITTDAVQIFGGYGYTKEYPVEKLMRDAKLMQIYEGTSQIQRIVISRELNKSIKG